MHAVLWAADERWTDLVALIAGAADGVTVVCWSGTLYRLHGPAGLFLRQPGPATYERDGDGVVATLDDLTVATSCGLIICGVHGPEDWVGSTRVVAVLDGFHATEVDERVAGLFRRSPADVPVDGHPVGSCGALRCQNA